MLEFSAPEKFNEFLKECAADVYKDDNSLKDAIANSNDNASYFFILKGENIYILSKNEAAHTFLDNLVDDMDEDKSNKLDIEHLDSNEMAELITDDVELNNHNQRIFKIGCTLGCIEYLELVRNSLAPEQSKQSAFDKSVDLLKKAYREKNLTALPMLMSLQQQVKDNIPKISSHHNKFKLENALPEINKSEHLNSIVSKVKHDNSMTVRFKAESYEQIINLRNIQGFESTREITPPILYESQKIASLNDHLQAAYDLGHINPQTNEWTPAGIRECKDFMFSVSNPLTLNDLSSYVNVVLFYEQDANKINEYIEKHQPNPEFEFEFHPYTISDTNVVRTTEIFDRLFEKTTMHQDVSDYVAACNNEIEKQKQLAQSSINQQLQENLLSGPEKLVPISFATNVNHELNSHNVVQNFIMPFVQCKSMFILEHAQGLLKESSPTTDLLNNIFDHPNFTHSPSQDNILQLAGLSFELSRFSEKPDQKELDNYASARLNAAIFQVQFVKDIDLNSMYHNNGHSHILPDTTIIAMPEKQYNLMVLLTNYESHKNDNNIDEEYLAKLGECIQNYVEKESLIVPIKYLSDNRIFTNNEVKNRACERLLNQLDIMEGMKEECNQPPVAVETAQLDSDEIEIELEDDDVFEIEVLNEEDTFEYNQINFQHHRAQIISNLEKNTLNQGQKQMPTQPLQQKQNSTITPDNAVTQESNRTPKRKM